LVYCTDLTIHLVTQYESDSYQAKYQ